VQDHGLAIAIAHRLCVRTQTHDVLAWRRRILAMMTSVQGADNLAEDAPDKLFIRVFAVVLELLDDAPEVAIAAVLHVQVEVLRRLEVLALVVPDDIRVDQLLQYGEFGLELFAFLGRHLGIADLFATEDLSTVSPMRGADVAHDVRIHPPCA
jgi:hypothetical protein